MRYYKNMSDSSRYELDSVDIRLRKLINELRHIRSVSVIRGHVGRSAQNITYFYGRSCHRFPHSKHNRMPSLAVDIVPVTFTHNNVEESYLIAGMMMALAWKSNIKIVWGMDTKLKIGQSDHIDCESGHFEIVEKIKKNEVKLW